MNALKNLSNSLTLVGKKGMRGISQTSRKLSGTVAATKSGEEAIPQEFEDEPHVHIAFLKLRYLYELMHVTEDAEKEKIWKNYDLSPGWSTLDWIWGNPPPFHTYDEIPIVKEFEGERKPHH